LRLEWDRYLKVLRQDGLLDDWYDAMLQPDDRVDEKIMKELYSADVVILLMSVDFMGSWYVRNKELPVVVSRWNEGKCRLIPVVLRNWAVVKNNKDVKVWNPLPHGADARPKAIVDFANHDDGWDQVYDALREILEELGKAKPAQ
ncbi:MAG: toll/interleukin-1 receptor domain-containing protein, partial [Flavobacteriales bacterium]|nr:toll/interleukin-1 receptor domain-containing protein [Flavobacteriales bacterium]